MAKYEALLADLQLVKEMQARSKEVKNDLHLVVNQVNGKFIAKDKMMIAYLAEVTKLPQYFSKFELSQIPREKNENTDVLSKLASTKNVYLFKILPVESLLKSSICQIGKQTRGYKKIPRECEKS